MNGIIKDILTAEHSGDRLVSSPTATLEAGKGIVGDRYYSSQGTFSEHMQNQPDFEVSLIEQEKIDEFNAITGHHYSGHDFRRNIVTQGIQLNELVGKSFSIGNVTLKGIRLCEPCSYLSARLGSEVMDYMVHKAGLRAQIIHGGEIHISDFISD
ncbi:MAG: MOSC domain-containing protein [Gammaproteobacteria bacterium]|nr:MOSC domain-containing protein [Gammaproteobacteria bacterium]